MTQAAKEPGAAVAPRDESTLAGSGKYLPPLTSPTEEQFAHILPALWRTLVRASRSVQDQASVDSHMIVIRILSAAGSISPAELADILHVSRPTISHLLKNMAAAGLIEKRRSYSDGRSITVSPTPHGLESLETFRNDRVDILAQALRAVPPDQFDALVQALPALRTLHREIDNIARSIESDDGDREQTA